ncbi:MAG TPA: hypothetical protein GXX77_00725 [Candidatus Cloacimonetes bacterium]|nr:hypothetical protein [Candidatus Cloacimonadota bacterium]
MINPRLVYILLLLALLSACAHPGFNQYPLSKKYPNYRDLPEDISNLMQANPQLIRHRIIGFSEDGRLPIYAIEVGSGERNILLIGQHHGDEVLGTALAMHLSKRLVQRKKEERIAKILDEYTLWIIPSINPDGWQLVVDGEARIKRKNNRDTDFNGKLDVRTDGVDLNRNYPIFWDLDQETNILSPFYKGNAPASESEVQAVISFGRKVDFELAIFYHSSATGRLNERIFLPAVKKKDERFKRLEEIADFYANQLPRDYFKGSYTLHRGVSSRVGNARNFFYHGLEVDAMLVEIGGINKKGRSIIHPPAKILRKILKRQEKAFISLLEFLL